MSDRIQTPLISTAMAIIQQDGKYLMQLRDNIPGIAYPGVWGFFGGHLEPGEEPEGGLRRELIEEIGYQVDRLKGFRSIRVSKGKVHHLFSCSLTVALESLQLNEGWDLKLLTKAEIERGEAYSSQAGTQKPLGDIHRQILLDFIAAREQN